MLLGEFITEMVSTVYFLARSLAKFSTSGKWGAFSSVPPTTPLCFWESTNHQCMLSTCAAGEERSKFIKSRAMPSAKQRQSCQVCSLVAKQLLGDFEYFSRGKEPISHPKTQLIYSCSLTASKSRLFFCLMGLVPFALGSSGLRACARKINQIQRCSQCYNMLEQSRQEIFYQKNKKPAEMFECSRNMLIGESIGKLAIVFWMPEDVFIFS